MNIKINAETIVDRQFTREGSDMCFDVCCQYRSRMIKAGPVEIKLTDAYCGYNEGSNDNQTVLDSDMQTTCTCTYRLECNVRNKILTYTFKADSSGYVQITCDQ